MWRFSSIRLLALLAAAVWAVAGTAVASARVALDPKEIRQWADSIFEPSFQEHRFSGAAIVIVQDGKIILSRSYGYADLAAKKPIDPDKTRFQIASVTKTFTGTALAQLMDRGLIESLDDPANKYLKRVHLPQGFGKDVTLRHLLTHQSGFDETSFEMFLTDRKVPVPVSGDEIARHMPPIIREPGTLSVYSNFGLSVIGWVVEDVSGLSLDEYFKRHIFSPLSMTHSLLDLRNHNDPELARPYGYYPNGELKPGQPVGGHPMYAGAGDIQSSMHDMARYMMAHLARGRGDGPHLMSPDMYEMMHARHAGNHPAVKGHGMAFTVGTWNGERTISHGGHLPGFMSEMLLLPDSNIGVFTVVMIGDANITLIEKIKGWFGDNKLTPISGLTIERPLTQLDVAHMFQTRYLGVFTPEAGPSNGALEQYVGRYLTELRPRTSIEKAFSLLSPHAGITVVDIHEQGGLTVNGAGPYEQINRDVFWKKDAGPNIRRPVQSVFESPIYVFLRDGAGRITHVHSLHSAAASERMTGLSAGFFSSLLHGAFWISLTGFAALLWPVKSRGERAGQITAAAVAGLLLVAAGLLTLGFGPYDPLEFQLLLGRVWRFYGIMAIANIVSLIGILALYLAVKSWRSGYWGCGAWGSMRRVHYTALAVAAVSLIPPFWYGNLLMVQW